MSCVTRGMPNLRPFYVLIAACLTYDQLWLTAIVKFFHFVLVHFVLKTQFLLPGPQPPSGLKKHPPCFTSLEVVRRIRHQKTQARKRAQMQPLAEELKRVFQLCQTAAPSQTVYGAFYLRWASYQRAKEKRNLSFTLAPIRRLIPILPPGHMCRYLRLVGRRTRFDQVMVKTMWKKLEVVARIRQLFFAQRERYKKGMKTGTVETEWVELYPENGPLNKSQTVLHLLKYIPK